MTKQGGTTKSHRPKHVTQSQLLFKQQANAERAMKSAKQPARAIKIPKSKPPKRNSSNKDGDAVLLVLIGYLLTKRWFWYTIATLFVIGLFLRMLNPGSI